MSRSSPRSGGGHCANDLINLALGPYVDAARRLFEHEDLRRQVRRKPVVTEPERVDDGDVMRLLKVMLKANGKQGVPQGGVISPLLSNLYLTEVDRMLERAKEAMSVLRHIRVARSSRTASWPPWMSSTDTPSSILGPIGSTRPPDMIRISSSMN